MKILGIDPGYTRIGYGFIESSLLSPIEYGVIEIKSKHPYQRIRDLSKEIEILLKKTSPDIVAIEKVYFSKNQKTAMDVAEARGIIKLSVIQKHLPLFEYGPREIKLSVTNYGLSDKKGVAKMVYKILRLKEIKGPDDITDALAIAITAANRYKLDKIGLDPAPFMD